MKSVLENNTLFQSMRVALLLLLSLTYGMLWAQSGSVPDAPKPPRLYNDLTASGNFLSADEAANIEAKLVQFNDSTSNQIAVVIVDDFNDLTPSEFGTEIIHKWGIGQAKKDNGVVIVIATGGESGKRGVNISTGYGLEGAIPDLMCKRIIETTLVPNLKSGDYYAAINESTDILMSLAKGEYNDAMPKPLKKALTKGFIIFIIFIIFILVMANRNRRGGMTIGPRGTWFGGGPWGGGGWGGGSWGGGSSGGGFGGFGGGSSGGGGASGSW